MCLSGLQSTLGIGTWGAVIIKSLGFTAIKANLLNIPPTPLGMLGTFLVALAVDRTKRYGYAILFAGTWTVIGLIALYVRTFIRLTNAAFDRSPLQHLPVTQQASWSFYAAYVYTLAAP